MTLNEFTVSALNPALAWLPARMDTPAARVQLLATGLQESEFVERRQRGGGPARSFFQMERGGGVLGVLRHPASQNLARLACVREGVPAESTAVWNEIENNDWLAAVFARLLYFTDPLALPDPTDTQGAWGLYLRTWRPGAFARDPIGLRDKWTRCHRGACAYVLQ